MPVSVVSKDNYRQFITDPYMVPSWEQCCKAVRILTNGSKASDIPFDNEVSLGDGRSFDWKVFVANHRWVDELLSFEGIVQATATRHEANQHYHLFLHCGDGQRLLVTNSTLRRFDTTGEKHWMKQSERAVLKGFDEALCALRENGWDLREGGWQNGNFNASIRDMVGEFFSEAIFGVALGDPATPHWTRVLENPEVIKVREDPRMMTVLDDYDLRARWVEYVQEHFVILKLSDYGTKNLCRLKAMSLGSSTSRSPSHACSAIPLKTRRLALLYPAPALQHTREAVELPPHTMLSLSLANPVGMLVCDSGAFFLRVSTSTQQGYLRISDAPYSAGPLLGPADDFCRGFKARRYTVQEAETRYDAKPSAVWSPSEPQVSPTRQPADVNEIDSVTSDELTIYRTDAAVEVLRHDRLWRISSNPFYYRGEIPPWRGIEMVLNGDKKDLKTRRVTLRITELERILSFGLTECNAEDCLCRVKYPGVQQEATRRKCADSVGFSTTGKKWDRGRLCQDGVCDMNVGDVISLVLGVDDSGSMFKIVEFIVNGKPCPVTLEAKRSGRLIFKGSGKWSVALLLGESESSESEELLDNDIITPTKPLWQPRPLPSGGGWQDVTC